MMSGPHPNPKTPFDAQSRGEANTSRLGVKLGQPMTPGSTVGPVTPEMHHHGPSRKAGITSWANSLKEFMLCSVVSVPKKKEPTK